MTAFVGFTAAAERDLIEVAEYIADRAPERALTFIAELRSACEQIADFPKRFPVVGRFQKQGVRRRAYGDYLILYIATADRVEIVRVIHGARDYEALLFPEP